MNADYPRSSAALFKLLVKTILRILGILILTGGSPSFMPKMNRVSAVEVYVDAGFQHSMPVSVTNRTKNMRRLAKVLQAELRNCLADQPRSRLSPNQLLRPLALANLPRIRHRATASRRFDDAARDYLFSSTHLGRKNLFFGKIQRRETDHISVGPPTAALQQQLIPKEIREACVTRLVFVLKDAGSR